MLRAGGLPHPAVVALNLLVSGATTLDGPAATATAVAGVVGSPSAGYRRIAALLRQEGWRVGKRQVQRLRRGEGLRVPPTKRKIVRRGVSTGWPVKATHRGHVWTWDFMADATVRGGALRMLTIIG